MNVHALISGMSPWGTYDDVELINMEENDANEYVLPIWNGIEGHEDFESPIQAVHAFFAKIKPFFEVDVMAMGGDAWMDECKIDDFMEGLGRNFEMRLPGHLMSILMGD